MVDLTVVILTKDEEKNIKKCVKSVASFAKRIVIVDSFSDDQTIEIARELGCDVYQHKFSSHARQFNWALENTKINTEWIMKLDADEEVLPNLANEIVEKLPSLSKNISGIMIKRRVYFMGRWIKHGGYYPTWLLRIFRNGRGKSEEKLMDEHIIIWNGKIIKFKNDFIDKNEKSLSWWISKHNWYSDREAFEALNLQKLKENGEFVTPKLTGNFNERKRWLKENVYLKLPKGFRAWTYYMYRYYVKLGFLDGKEGKIFHFLQAYWYRFLVDAKIYEVEKNGNMEELKKKALKGLEDK